MELQNLTLKELTKKYSDDYFDNNTLKVLEYSLRLIKHVHSGSFEYDTMMADRLLTSLKDSINKVDI